MKKILLAPFDHSGNLSEPYRQNGWRVIQIDIKHGYDFLDFNILDILREEQYQYALPVFGIIAPLPCTAYALTGNRHKNTLERKIIFDQSQLLVEHLRKIIMFLQDERLLLFWQLENPSSDIHTHNKWLGKPTQKFNPCDFAGYLDWSDEDKNNLSELRQRDTETNPYTKDDVYFMLRMNVYNKKTWVWGNFRPMTSKRIEPIEKDSPIWKYYGGKSEKVKEKRSVTPMGFAWAFYEANH